MKSTSKKLWKEIGVSDIQSTAHDFIQHKKSKQTTQMIFPRIQQKLNDFEEKEKEDCFNQLDLSEIQQPKLRMETSQNKSECKLFAGDHEFQEILSVMEYDVKNRKVEGESGYICGAEEKLMYEKVRQILKIGKLELRLLKGMINRLSKNLRNEVQRLKIDSQNYLFELYSVFCIQMQYLQSENSQLSRTIQKVKQTSTQLADKLNRLKKQNELLEMEGTKSFKQKQEMKILICDMTEIKNKVEIENDLLKEQIQEMEQKNQVLSISLMKFKEREEKEGEIDVGKRIKIKMQKSEDIEKQKMLGKFVRSSNFGDRMTKSESFKLNSSQYLSSNYGLRKTRNNSKQKQIQSQNSNAELKSTKISYEKDQKHCCCEKVQEEPNSQKDWFLPGCRYSFAVFNKNKSTVGQQSNENQYLNEIIRKRSVCSQNPTGNCLRSENKLRKSQHFEIGVIEQKIKKMKFSISSDIKSLKQMVFTQLF